MRRQLLFIAMCEFVTNKFLHRGRNYNVCHTDIVHRSWMKIFLAVDTVPIYEPISRQQETSKCRRFYCLVVL